jgi:trehalose utilization protein
MTRVTVWGENVHERRDAHVREVYPETMHECIAAALREDTTLRVRTATLDQPEHGLSEAALADTDVLTWWGHAAHDQVADAVVDRVHRRVLEGMGLVVLHSGHYSKIFKLLMGTTCSLTWREADELERVWICDPGHPIAQGLPRFFEIEKSEMYGEPFGIPPPDEQVFLSWFEGGEVFRSGCTWRRGNGRVFYFSPGHEAYPIFRDANVRQVLRNAVRWAAPTSTVKDACPMITMEETPERDRLKRRHGARPKPPGSSVPGSQ